MNSPHLCAGAGCDLLAMSNSTAGAAQLAPHSWRRRRCGVRGAGVPREVNELGWLFAVLFQGNRRNLDIFQRIDKIGLLRQLWKAGGGRAFRRAVA